GEEANPKSAPGRLSTSEGGPMRGHVRKRGNKWCIVYDEGYDENKKRRQRWQSGFETRKQAQEELTATLNRLHEGSYVAPSKITLGEFLEQEWLPAIGGPVRSL